LAANMAAGPAPRADAASAVVIEAAAAAPAEATDAGVEELLQAAPARPEQPASAPTDLSAVPAPVSGTPEAVSTGGRTLAASEVSSSVAQRVEAAVQALEMAPDPKRLTLQLDDLGGLRMVVSLRPDGVHVNVVGDSESLPAGWDRDLGRALRDKGYSLGGDAAGSRREGGRGDNPHEERPDTSWWTRNGRPAGQPSGGGWRL
jgi:hypothetical protein